jgi:hypothetical protein
MGLRLGRGGLRSRLIAESMAAMGEILVRREQLAQLHEDAHGVGQVAVATATRDRKMRSRVIALLSGELETIQERDAMELPTTLERDAPLNFTACG